MNSDISLAFQKIKSTIPDGVCLVAVSKTKPVHLIQEIYDQGQRIFGENRVQELVEKYNSLPKDIQWHLIGHLQRNKVKYIVPFVDVIHSIDSERLLDEVDSCARKNKRSIKILLQFFIAKEETKFGFDLTEIEDLFARRSPQSFDSIEFCGVMGMASFSDNNALVREEFKSLSKIFKQLKTSYFSKNSNFKEISMGMSGDYLIAIEEGSTMVRIGSSLFGGR